MELGSAEAEPSTCVLLEITQQDFVLLRQQHLLLEPQLSVSCEQGSELELRRIDAPTLRVALHIPASILALLDRNLLGR